MVASETTCTAEGIYGLVCFNRLLTRTGNHLLLFDALFALLVFSAMPGLMLRPETGGYQRWHATVALAVAHLKDKRTAIWPTQVTHVAQHDALLLQLCIVIKSRSTMMLAESVARLKTSENGSTTAELGGRGSGSRIFAWGRIAMLYR